MRRTRTRTTLAAVTLAVGLLGSGVSSAHGTTHDVDFHDLGRVHVVSQKELTEGRGFQQQMAQFVVERMFAAYGTPTSVRRALQRTRDYLRDRTAFGKPLLANQYLQFKLAELSAKADMLESHNYACADAFMAGEDTTRYATVSKLMAGRLVREVADTCLQFYGGMGYMEETWVSRFFRDSRLLSIGGGADEVMLQVLAKLDGFDA